MTGNMRILVIEDEYKVAAALKKGLEAEHYDAVLAYTGAEGFFQISGEAFDLVILDLGLPGRDGLEILTILRKRGVATPVLILTARDTVADRVGGLDSGADAYMVKPFALPELLARIRRLLRRGRPDDVSINKRILPEKATCTFSLSYPAVNKAGVQWGFCKGLD